MKTKIIIPIILVVALAAAWYFGVFPDISGMLFSIASPNLHVTDGCTGDTMETVSVYNHDSEWNELKFRYNGPGNYVIRHNEEDDYWMVCDGVKYVFADGATVTVMDYRRGWAWRNVMQYLYEPIENAIDTGAICKTISASEVVNAHEGGYAIEITITPECPPPEETCYDGIQNQDETGVDCGGVCPACEEPPPPPPPPPDEEFPWLIIILSVALVVMLGLAAKYL